MSLWKPRKQRLSKLDQQRKPGYLQSVHTDALPGNSHFLILPTRSAQHPASLRRLDREPTTVGPSIVPKSLNNVPPEQGHAEPQQHRMSKQHQPYAHDRQ